jgi:hypothetical protein
MDIINLLVYGGIFLLGVAVGLGIRESRLADKAYPLPPSKAAPRPPSGRPIFAVPGWRPDMPEHKFLVRGWQISEVGNMPAAFRRMVGRVEDDRCEGR